jgi:hypothetical protein
MWRSRTILGAQGPPIAGTWCFPLGHVASPDLSRAGSGSVAIFPSMGLMSLGLAARPLKSFQRLSSKVHSSVQEDGVPQSRGADRKFLEL